MEDKAEIMRLSIMVENLSHQYNDMLTMLSSLSTDMCRLENKCNIIENDIIANGNKISDIEKEQESIKKKNNNIEDEISKMRITQRWLSVKI